MGKGRSAHICVNARKWSNMREISVNSPSLGYVMTDMVRGLQTRQPELAKPLKKDMMFGRIGAPEELKGGILFFYSKAKGRCAGQDLLIDGGASSRKHAVVISVETRTVSLFIICAALFLLFASGVICLWCFNSHAN